VLLRTYGTFEFLQFLQFFCKKSYGKIPTGINSLSWIIKFENFEFTFGIKDNALIRRGYKQRVDGSKLGRSFYIHKQEWEKKPSLVESL